MWWVFELNGGENLTSRRLHSSNMPIPTEFNEQEIRRYRLNRVQQEVKNADCAGIILFDPVNLRYATGSRNMQVWTMHNYCRYAFIPTEGPVVLFDLPSASHLSADLETIDEIRPSLASDYMMVGPRGEEFAQRWVRQLVDVACPGKKVRIAIDRADLLMTQAAVKLGLILIDGKPLMERARAIKSLEEIAAFKHSLNTCEQSIDELRAIIQPGMRESDALGVLIKASIERGGEYPETRLLTSGPRTNPWFQETSDRVIQDGDMLSFDTDLIGPMGFYNDISRSWVIGDAKPTDRRKRLYNIACEQLQHNIALLRPGISFLEYSDKAYQLPDECIPNRYADVAHGCGLGVEYPLIWYREDAQWGAYDGVFEENMIVCVECYVGETGGEEGVKLEQPVWIRAGGPVVLADYPLDL